MASKQGHEHFESYVDNINVKISERYKPPPRINVAVTYAQRLTLNRNIQDNMPNYEFVLEKSVLEKMKEWREVRKTTSEVRKTRVSHLKEELKKKLLQVSTSYSNILTPIPLINQQYKCKPDDKSPFNPSDFENDTSSPFDNMELKSINDMEELAQVLKTNTAMYQPYQVSPQLPNQVQQGVPNYTGYTYNVPQTVSSYMRPVVSDYSHTNGYYYPSLDSGYVYSKPSNAGLGGVSQMTSLSDIKRPACKSVPDIIKSLEVELANSHLDSALPSPSSSSSSSIRGYASPETNRPKSSEASVYPVSRGDELENPFHSLPKVQQDLCVSVNSMGFPLARVARTCKRLGGDHKKIVEHLLALSDLLDLGFSEKKVSEALLQCDNDRDKALDKLIS